MFGIKEKLLNLMKSEGIDITSEAVTQYINCMTLTEAAAQKRK